VLTQLHTGMTGLGRWVTKYDSQDGMDGPEMTENSFDDKESGVRERGDDVDQAAHSQGSAAHRHDRAGQVGDKYDSQDGKYGPEMTKNSFNVKESGVGERCEYENKAAHMHDRAGQMGDRKDDQDGIYGPEMTKNSFNAKESGVGERCEDDDPAAHRHDRAGQMGEDPDGKYGPEMTINSLNVMESGVGERCDDDTAAQKAENRGDDGLAAHRQDGAGQVGDEYDGQDEMDGPEMTKNSLNKMKHGVREQCEDPDAHSQDRAGQVGDEYDGQDKKDGPEMTKNSLNEMKSGVRERYDDDVDPATHRQERAVQLDDDQDAHRQGGAGQRKDEQGGQAEMSNPKMIMYLTKEDYTDQAEQLEKEKIGNNEPSSISQDLMQSRSEPGQVLGMCGTERLKIQDTSDLMQSNVEQDLMQGKEELNIMQSRRTPDLMQSSPVTYHTTLPLTKISVLPMGEFKLPQ